MNAKIQEYHESNRQAWNEGAAAYEQSLEDSIRFLREGGMHFCLPEQPYLEGLETWCVRAVHLQCAGGTDTLSLWNKGAKEVIGIDISERMIEVARRKAEALNAPARWIRCDVLETPHELDGTADLVYTGRGAINWIMDIGAWAHVPARLLKPGGVFFLFEGHPISNIWDMEASEWRLDPVWGDYFQERIEQNQGWSTQYIGDLGKPLHEHAMKYERQWTLAALVNALLQTGLTLERMGEYPDPFWEQFPNLSEDLARRLPHTLALWMRKGHPSSY